MEQKNIFEVIKRDCSPFLNSLKNCETGHFLVRGYFYEIEDIKIFEHNLENRKPKNMAQDIHDKINNFFYSKFSWKIRNGIFCYGFDLVNNHPIDLGYGLFFIFFPIGNFDYVYSPDHFDLFGYFNQTKGNVDELIKKLIFKNDSFCDVMTLHDQYDKFGNEVSIRATSYYLINIKYADSLSQKIWG